MTERPARKGGFLGPLVETEDGFLTPKNYVAPEMSKDFQEHARISRTRWSIREFVKALHKQRKKNKDQVKSSQ